MPFASSLHLWVSSWPIAYDMLLFLSVTTFWLTFLGTTPHFHLFHCTLSLKDSYRYKQLSNASPTNIQATITFLGVVCEHFMSVRVQWPAILRQLSRYDA